MITGVQNPSGKKKVKQVFCLLALACALLLALGSRANASATLLLEEPYGTLGFFTATGHAAVYLSNVCAQTPVVLRPCNPGEIGVVLSRYNGVAGYDWIAIPLMPYLYSVDSAEEIPLFVDSKIAAVLRDRYRRKYLESIVPDTANGTAPGGNWYELVGSSYDRTIYGYEIETSPKKDRDLIRKLNAAPNVSHFRTVSHNCADFAKDIINFYYPKSLHRSIVSDVGMTTPKQMAKNFVKLSARHPELRSSRLIIPQVPGSEARSFAVHGVVESFFKSKKYIVPSAIVSPIFAGCVAAVYVGSRGHFDPAHDALVFNPSGGAEAALGHEDRRAYQLELEHLLAAKDSSAPRVKKSWERIEAHANLSFDAKDRPVLEMGSQVDPVEVSVTAGEVTSSAAPGQITEQLLEARLQAELHEKSPHCVAESDVTRDWNLLQQVLGRNNLETSSQAKQSPIEAAALPRPDARGERVRGNKP